VITMNSFVNGIFEGIAAEAYHTTMWQNDKFTKRPIA
jgi:hypothetical protein